MNNPSKVFEQELKKLEKLIQAAEKDLKKAPPGTLRIAKNKGTNQYYWRNDPKNTRGKYIKKKNIKIAEKLAQKDYAQKARTILNASIKREREKLRLFNEPSAQEELVKMYENLLPARQELITPYVCNDEDFAAQWEENKKLKKEELGFTSDINTEIFTNKGECVRSKSEKILADKLFALNIPYVYESPLNLRGYGYIKPDFLILNPRTRTEYYWEHFGIMDEKEYCEKALKKLESFVSNNILPGKNLISTYETKDHPLNSKIVDKFIKEYLI